MATTGFWPVSGKLKKVLDYADNPDKTTAKEYLDEDLYQALQYTEQDTTLRKRAKRVKRIRKDAPRLLNLLKTELQREYERKHPVKEQQRQRIHRHEPER